MKKLPSTVELSVIVAAFNAEDYLRQTLASILDQSFTNFEVLVIDDGSTDRTAEIAADIEERVILIRQDNSGGPSRPRNIGLDRARGDLVAFCDSDDVMLPGKLATSIAVFDKHPEVDFVFTDFQTINEQDEILVPSFLSRYHSFRKALCSTADQRCHLLSGEGLIRELYLGNFIGTSSVMARRAVLLQAGGFDEDLMNSEDIDLWLRVARTGAVFALLEMPLHCYRKRRGSISCGGSGKVANIIRRVEKNLPWVPDDATRRAVLANLRSLLITYGYTLRTERKYRQSVAAYRRAATMGLSMPIVIGWLRSQILGWFLRTDRSA